MARRQIISRKYPYLPIKVKLRGQSIVAQALIDTGFTGNLSIPKDIFNGNIGLPDLYQDWQLANGKLVSAPMYHGIIEISGMIAVPVLVSVMGEDYVIGRGIVNRFKVTFDHGKRVIVEL